jgi:hypothetical protein
MRPDGVCVNQLCLGAAECDGATPTAGKHFPVCAISDQESHGGGNQGKHGRRRQPLGHVRALMARAKANTWVRLLNITAMI